MRRLGCDYWRGWWPVNIYIEQDEGIGILNIEHTKRPLLPSDLAQPPALPLRRWAWARRLHGCLSRCKEAWLQRQYTASGTKDTPPAPPLSPTKRMALLCAHIEGATDMSRLAPARKWWARALDDWKWK